MKRTPILAMIALLFSTAALAQVPSAGHVFVVVEENHSYGSVIGNASMPYLNTLASQYGLATAYYANTHPSIGNYFMLTTGQIITNNDSYTGTVTADNIVRHFLTGAKTWKSYAEGLPYAGYTGGDTGGYMKHHNPFAYFSDVVNSSVQKMNLVPFSQFASDRANGRLPQFSFIVPNRYNDAHDGSLAQADYWLKTNIAPLIASSSFQQSGLLIIVFDESYSSDTAYGGGRVAMLVISPKAKKGYKSTTFYQHQSTLRLVMSALGLTSFPGKAAYAPTMGEFFGTTSSCTASVIGVTICLPLSGLQPSTTVKFSAAAKGYAPISSMMIYVDNTAKYTTYSASLARRSCWPAARIPSPSRRGTTRGPSTRARSASAFRNSFLVPGWSHPALLFCKKKSTAEAVLADTKNLAEELGGVLGEVAAFARRMSRGRPS